MRGAGAGWIAVFVCVACASDTKVGSGDGGAGAAGGTGGQSTGGRSSTGGTGNSGGRNTGGGAGTGGSGSGTGGNAGGGGRGMGGGVSNEDGGASRDASTEDGGDAGRDGGLVCTNTRRFGEGCPAEGCPTGTLCVTQIGGVAGGGGDYCAIIPKACNRTLTCACLGECVCGPRRALPPGIDWCSETPSGKIECDNGIR